MLLDIHELWHSMMSTCLITEWILVTLLPVSGHQCSKWRIFISGMKNVQTTSLNDLHLLCDSDHQLQVPVQYGRNYIFTLLNKSKYNKALDEVFYWNLPISRISSYPILTVQGIVLCINSAQYIHALQDSKHYLAHTTVQVQHNSQVTDIPLSETDWDSRMTIYQWP